MSHSSRKAIIEKRAALGNGGQARIQHASNASSSGASRSTRSTQDGELGRRRRQSKSKVLGGRPGTDSSGDVGAGGNREKCVLKVLVLMICVQEEVRSVLKVCV